MRLEGLNPLEYEHPDDAKALEALENIPGVRDVALKIWELFLDKILFVESTGSFVEINDNNSSKLYGLFRDACEILDFEDIPPFYLQGDQKGTIGAFARGVDRPFVSITYGCVERFNDNEMLYILGHELGHIKSGHVLYRSIANEFNEYFKELSNLSFGLANLVSVPAMGIEIAMKYWSRMSELTCDRAGLLVCKDLDSAIKATIKLAGFPSSDCSRISYLDISAFVESFKNQALEFEKFEMDEFNKLTRYYITKNNLHPWNVLRVSELLKWVDSGDFDRILKRERTVYNDQDTYKIQSIPKSSKFCPNCGASISSTSKFCSGCGTQINNGP